MIKFLFRQKYNIYTKFMCGIYGKKSDIWSDQWISPVVCVLHLC